MSFTGFTSTTLAFLNDLALNNHKEWFEAHRDIYETHVLRPLRDLTISMAPAMKDIDPYIDTTPAINKTISRIYRDTRFSTDKRPLRNDLWISFRRPKKDWGNTPEFYFYFTPEKYEFGMGFYCATPANMSGIRNHINARPEIFRPIVDFYESQKESRLGGEDYKKPVANPHSPSFQRWLQKKNLHVNTARDMDELFFSPQLKEMLEKAWWQHADLYRFISEGIYQ